MRASYSHEIAHQARASRTTRRRPRGRRRGVDLTTISTSCPSLVRRRISRSLEATQRTGFGANCSDVFGILLQRTS